MGGFFGFWNTRQANQIKRLSDEATQRAGQRLSEREADRLDREAKEKEFVFWRDAHRELSKQYSDEHTSYVALATKHDEFRRDYDALKLQLQELIKLSERQAQEVIHLKGEQDKALNTISSMHDDRVTAVRNYEDQISRLNDAATRKQDLLQTQLNELTEQIRIQGVKIKALQDQLREFGDANMALAMRIETLQNENDRLTKDNKRLLVELTRLGAFVGPYDYTGYGDAVDVHEVSAVIPQPEPPDPPPPPDGSGAKQSVPPDITDMPDLSRTERAA